MTANQVTITAVVLSLVTGVGLGLAPTSRVALFAVPAVLFLRMALNAIDGMLAREHDMKSRLGAVLNEIGDVIADAGLYLPLAFVIGMNPILVVCAVVLAIVSEMAGVVAIQIGAERRYDGPMGKSDRAFVFGLIAFLLGCGVNPGRWQDVLLVAMCGLLAVTVWNRSRRALIGDAGRATEAES